MWRVQYLYDGKWQDSGIYSLDKRQEAIEYVSFIATTFRIPARITVCPDLEAQERRLEGLYGMCYTYR